MIHHGEERFGSVLDFKNIIGCVQPGVNPFKYNNYGCYCSFGGHGTPVDEVDQCCKVHDEFYGVQMRIPQCRGFFKQRYFIYSPYEQVFPSMNFFFADDTGIFQDVTDTIHGPDSPIINTRSWQKITLDRNKCCEIEMNFSETLKKDRRNNIKYYTTFLW
uniref:Phospholipase A2 n=1 Tax=Sparus aurata TaxID=8175 RepID=A0A671U3Z3_SPAAU